jgi:hypothetical protein
LSAAFRRGAGNLGAIEQVMCERIKSAAFGDRGALEMLGVRHAREDGEAEQQPDNGENGILDSHDLLLRFAFCLHPLMQYVYFKPVLQSDKDAISELIVHIPEQCEEI